MNEAEMEEMRIKLNRIQLMKDLTRVINCHSMENGSDTPDFILGEFLADCLEEFDKEISHPERPTHAKFLRGCLAVFVKARDAREQWHVD